jgi:hypothetical protein
VSTFRLSPIVFVIFCFTGFLYGQAWSGILDPSRAVDWSQAGVVGGIPTNRTQCVTTACNTVSNGTTVTSASINAAIASAPANTYIQVPAGTFALSDCILFQPPGNITLRGAGSNSTFITYSGVGCSGYSNGSNFNVVVVSADTSGRNAPANVGNWTGTNGVSGTYTQGATSITLNGTPNPSRLVVGNPIILDQIDDQSDNGALYVGCEYPADNSPACYNGTWPGGFTRGNSLATGRGQQQIVNITSISGSGTGPYTVGISPGIYAANWQTSHTPQAWWSSSPIQNVGLENFSLAPAAASAGAIWWRNCTGCWARGIRVVGATTTGQQGWGAIYIEMCNHCEVRDSYFYGNATADDYVIAADGASDLLVENNITQLPGTSSYYSADCEGCVAAYNFGVNRAYGAGNVNAWFAQSSEYHAVELFSLLEGNIGGGLYADSFHGTHVLNTQFRNRWDGKEQNNGHATSSGTVPLRLNPGARYDNAIGNVLGTPGYHTNYKATPSGGNLYTSAIGAGVYPEVGMNDGLVATTAMFWGNWDTATGAAHWNASEVPSGLSSYSNAVPASQTLPASFFHSSEPSWWPSDKPWPPIGPDVSGGNVGQCLGGTFDTSEAFSSAQCAGGTLTPIGGGKAYSLPAMDCYFNVMGGVANGTGKPLAFDPSACYSSSSKGINPPSGLTAVVH